MMSRKGFLLGKVLPGFAGIGLIWVVLAFLTHASQDAQAYSASLSQLQVLQTKQEEMDERLSLLFTRINWKQNLWDGLVDNRLTCKETIEAFLWLNQHSEFPNPELLGSFETQEARNHLLEMFLDYHEGHDPSYILQNDVCTVFDKWQDEQKTMGKISPEMGEKGISVLNKR